MGNEISQLDASVIQLRESSAQPKVSYSREIGEAEIIHTIFGKAKVRIIRKHDKFRRALWLTAAFGVAAGSTMALQSWYEARQAEITPSVESAPSSGVPVQALAPADTENAVASAVAPAAALEPAASAPAVTAKLVPVQQAVPQPLAERPAAIEPKVVQTRPAPPSAHAAAPHAAPASPLPTTPSGAVGNVKKMPAVTLPADKPLPAKASVPAVTAPAVAKPAVQPAASSPAATPAPEAPVVKEGISAVDRQLSAPINAQGK